MCFLRVFSITHQDRIKLTCKYFYRNSLNFSFPESIHLIYFSSIKIFGRAQQMSQFRLREAHLESIIVQHCCVARTVKTLNLNNSLTQRAFDRFGSFFHTK